MARPDHLAPLETAVFHAVARYRFINVALLGRVVDGSRQSIRDATRRLRVLGLLGGTAPKAHKFAPGEPEARREFGKPASFWVSVKGARRLAVDRLTDPATPLAIGSTSRGTKPDQTEHRLGIVAVHIAFRAWAEATGRAGVSFLTDFERGGRGIGKVTAVPYQFEGNREWYRPDGFARFRLAPGAPMQTLVLEFERGGAAYEVSPFFLKKLPGIRRVEIGVEKGPG